MPNRLAIFGLLSVHLLSSDPAAAKLEATQRVCPGMTLASFEQKVPAQVQRFAFERALLEPFVELWRAARRPALPVQPERVTVYAVPGKPFLIGYQNGDCVIAFLAVERRRLWQWLRPRLGWTA